MQDGPSELMGKVVKMGDDLVVVLPADDAERLGFQEGENVVVHHASEVAQQQPSKTMTKEQAMAVFEKYRGRIPAGYKFNRDEANER